MYQINNSVSVVVVYILCATKGCVLRYLNWMFRLHLTLTRPLCNIWCLFPVCTLYSVYTMCIIHYVYTHRERRVRYTRARAIISVYDTFIVEINAWILIRDISLIGHRSPNEICVATIRTASLEARSMMQTMYLLITLNLDLPQPVTVAIHCTMHSMYVERIAFLVVVNL